VERLLQKKRPENYPLSIVRPAIIGAAWRDPFKGWVENITASTALFFLSGIGFLKYINSAYSKIGDIVPVDYVADWTIVVGAVCANKPGCHCFHSGTSYGNPSTYGMGRDAVEVWWSINPPEK
jgi:fatty acyl-CoA reductase